MVLFPTPTTTAAQFGVSTWLTIQDTVPAPASGVLDLATAGVNKTEQLPSCGPREEIDICPVAGTRVVVVPPNLSNVGSTRAGKKFKLAEFPPCSAPKLSQLFAGIPWFFSMHSVMAFQRGSTDLIASTHRTRSS